MVDRHFEKALDLVGMEVHGDDSIHTGGSEDIGDQLGSDGDPRLVFAVLSGKTEIRNDSDDPLGRSSSGGVDHEEQFEQIVCWRYGRLDDEYLLTSNGVFKRRLELPITEALDAHITQRLAEMLRDGFGEVGSG